MKTIAKRMLIPCWAISLYQGNIKGLNCLPTRRPAGTQDQSFYDWHSPISIVARRTFLLNHCKGMLFSKVQVYK